MDRKEAIEIVRKNWPDSSRTMLREALETLIPELAESLDEKIRKMLIRIYKKADMGGEIIGEGITYKQVIAWLEKQGEYTNFRNKIQIGDKVTRYEDGVLVNLSQLNRVAKKDEKQGEQKVADKVETKQNSDIEKGK